MADGSVVRRRGGARKSSAGYDLTRLLVGSEGTLGIMTELTVRLYGVPETVLSAVCPFATHRGRLQRRHPVDPARPRRGAHRAARRPADQAPSTLHSKLALEEAPTLFLEFHGTEAGAATRSRTSRPSPRARARIRFDWAESEEDRRRLWKARHDAYWAVKTVVARQGCAGDRRLRADLAAGRVRARDPEGHRGASASSRRSSATSATATSTRSPVFDRNNAAEIGGDRGLPRAAGRARAIAMDGTCTGEHGVGQGKSKYLKAELGDGPRRDARHQDGARSARHI